ncbi:MAG: hypothetical protein JNN01_23855 [Opitutaceae bacterium]|nr:hypothetical protein [Opitutaceae bacterium]
MKPSSTLVAVVAGLLVQMSAAAPLTEPTAVHLKADPASPAVAVLKAGTEPPLASGNTSAPPGWIAVELPGPHEVYVQNKDITKSLDVRPGAELRKGPKLDTPVLAVAGVGETLDITGLFGRWTQLRLNRPLVGYIRTVGLPAALPLASVPAAAPRPTPTVGAPTPAPVAPPPSKAAAVSPGTGGQPASLVSLGQGGTDALPRMFEGRFVSTRNPFKPRRPFDWALSDESGSRFAYLDVSRLLQTEQIENYTNRNVAVFGAAKPMPGTKDFVIIVESLQLK